jgi:hypothetical protein
VGESAADLSKAWLVELDADFKNPKRNGKQVRVQFNPETLKVSIGNRTQQQQAAGDQRGNSPRQVVGAGATKLSLSLWFDVTAPGADGKDDVRLLTQEVAYFMLPSSPPGAPGKDPPIPPGVRFLWGRFSFDGLMDSLEENLDFFSPDGRPLRSQLSLSLSGQVQMASTKQGGAAADAMLGPTPGLRPLTRAPADASVQSLASAAGQGGDWQSIAEANGVENPRLLAPGQLLDMSARASGSGPRGSAGSSI